jgi:succinate dehydrogenase / fumarate reductase cytochrome b subunit
MSDQFHRPLSPHLQIYRPMLTMMMSIAHRLTGVALYFGTIFMVWWLTAAATGPDYFNFVQKVFSSWPIQLVLFLFTWALIHHFIGGIRHLIWDTGRGFDLPTVERLAQLNLIGSIIIAIAIWIAAYLVRS